MKNNALISDDLLKIVISILLFIAKGVQAFLEYGVSRAVLMLACTDAFKHLTT